jgi:hypothetical protein
LANAITTAGPTSSSPLPRLGQRRSVDELTAVQDSQLAHTLSWAAASPSYRTMWRDHAWPANRADIAELPLTTKQDLRDNSALGMLAVDCKKVATYHESSGTSGEPTPSFYTTADRLDRAERRRGNGLRFGRATCLWSAPDTRWQSVVIWRTPPPGYAGRGRAS